MAVSAVHSHHSSLPSALSSFRPAPALEPRPYTQSRSNSRDPSPITNRGPEYAHFTPRPRFPPSPPMDRSSHVSLPPISTLLAPSRKRPAEDDMSAVSKESSTSNRRFASVKAPRLTSPPTPPTRHEYVDLHQTSAAQLASKRLPPMQSSYTRPHCMQRTSSLDHNKRSSVHHYHRSSTSSYETGSVVSTRAVSPSSVHSAPVEAPRHRPRMAQPRMRTDQRSLPSVYTPLTPYSPPSASSVVLRTSDPDALWRHAAPLHYPPYVAQTYSAGGSKPQSLSYPPQHQPPMIPPPDYMAGSISSQQHQQLPDRYLCPSCNKAFSRPSSLRIHVHSHTGEKPFRCPHTGCGKAFSVRSNMKRHQRGCHIEGAEGIVDHIAGVVEDYEAEDVA